MAEHYPKDADFPRVAECPDCHGTGVRTNPDWEPLLRNSIFEAWGARPIKRQKPFYTECDPCAGTGKIVPPEWLGQ